MNYLVWSLKTFFDEWVYASVKEMIQSSNPSLVTKSPKVDVTDERFLETMQKMVGGGIRAAKIQFCTKKCEDITFKNLFHALVFKDDGSSQIAPEYEAFNPDGIKYCNTGGLHLIPQSSIPWSIELLCFIIDSYADDRIMINRGEYIAVSLLNLCKDKTIFASFKKIIEQMGISIDVKCKNG